jgi:hypothetical protein
MAVDWKATKLVIAAFVSACTGLTASKVVWTDEPMPSLEAPYIELTISGEAGVGEDEVVWSDVVDDGTSYLEATVSGTREFTLSCRYRSRSSANDVSARTVLEQLKQSFFHPVRRRRLEAADIAYHDTLMLQTLKVEHDNRRESVAVLDVRLSVQSVYLPSSADRADPVLSVEITPTPGDTFTVAGT